MSLVFYASFRGRSNFLYNNYIISLIRIAFAELFLCYLSTLCFGIFNICKTSWRNDLYFKLTQFVIDIGKCDLQPNYYSQSCPQAEAIIKREVTNLYHKHGNTAVSWVRNLFHDCMVKVRAYKLSFQSSMRTTHNIWDGKTMEFDR